MPVIRSCHLTGELFIDSFQSAKTFHDQYLNYNSKCYSQYLIRVDFSHGAKDFLSSTTRQIYLCYFPPRVNLLHLEPSSFFYGLLLSLWCFSVVVNYYFGANIFLATLRAVFAARPSPCEQFEDVLWFFSRNQID